VLLGLGGWFLWTHHVRSVEHARVRAAAAEACGVAVSDVADKYIVGHDTRLGDYAQIDVETSDPDPNVLVWAQVKLSDNSATCLHGQKVTSSPATLGE
jgi:hypothetical protein